MKYSDEDILRYRKIYWRSFVLEMLLPLLLVSVLCVWAGVGDEGRLAMLCAYGLVLLVALVTYIAWIVRCPSAREVANEEYRRRKEFRVRGWLG